jgi:hypothetical protein
MAARGADVVNNVTGLFFNLSGIICMAPDFIRPRPFVTTVTVDPRSRRRSRVRSGRLWWLHPSV